VAVRTPDPAALTAALAAEGAAVRPDGEALAVTGLTAARIGELALQQGVLLNELTTRTSSLEEAFMQLTAGSAEHLAGERR
ncbi:ABC transporter, partial [Streptomyces nanshensis]